MKKNRLACGDASEFIVYLLVHLHHIWEGELVHNLGQFYEPFCAMRNFTSR